MSITTLIFDLGNVILTNDWHYNCPEKFKEYSDFFGLSYDDMERGWNAYWPQFNIGKITEDEFWKGFLQTAGAEKIDIKQAQKFWRKHQRPIKDMLNLLKKLKKHYRETALTTISKEWLDYKKEKYALDAYFEMIVSSGYSGLAKPRSQIYELIIQKLNVKPEECLFIDDAEENLLPAQQLGMKTIHFIGQKNLEEKLRELKIVF